MRCLGRYAQLHSQGPRGREAEQQLPQGHTALVGAGFEFARGCQASRLPRLPQEKGGQPHLSPHSIQLSVWLIESA